MQVKINMANFNATVLLCTEKVISMLITVYNSQSFMAFSEISGVKLKTCRLSFPHNGKDYAQGTALSL